MATEYVVQDRSTATRWALSVEDGEMLWTATLTAAQPDPVVLDSGDNVTLWTLFVDDGQHGQEVGGAAPSSPILVDSLGKAWGFVVEHGQFAVTVVVGGVRRLQMRTSSWYRYIFVKE